MGANTQAANMSGAHERAVKRVRANYHQLLLPVHGDMVGALAARATRQFAAPRFRVLEGPAARGAPPPSHSRGVAGRPPEGVGRDFGSAQGKAYLPRPFPDCACCLTN